MAFNPLNFFKRLFSSPAAKVAVATAATIAQRRADEKLTKTDKFTDPEKELIREGIRQFILELLSDDEEEGKS